ncbi:hypothetical protein NPIL_340731, partial [Nephila pilipes]
MMRAGITIGRHREWAIPSLVGEIELERKGEVSRLKGEI